MSNFSFTTIETEYKISPGEYTRPYKKYLYLESTFHKL